MGTIIGDLYTLFVSHDPSKCPLEWSSTPLLCLAFFFQKKKAHGKDMNVNYPSYWFGIHVGVVPSNRQTKIS